MFWENVARRITAVAIQLEHAEKKGISNVAKSAYYRSATVLICTVVEGMVYQLVKEHTNNIGHIVSKKEKLTILHPIPDAVFSQEGIVICQKSQVDVHIDDNGVTFGILNIFLKNKKIIDESEFNALNYVRKERNKLHLQGLDNSDTGYTKQKFNKASEPVDFLSKKLSKLYGKGVSRK